MISTFVTEPVASANAGGRSGLFHGSVPAWLRSGVSQLRRTMSKFTHSILIAVTCCTELTVARGAQSVIFTGRPCFEQRGQFVYLILSNANQSFDISWAMSPDFKFVPISLDTNQVYTFTVKPKPYQSITIPELRKVEFQRQTIYDIEVCEVHKIKMEHKDVEIAYGLILPTKDDPSPDTEQRLFPHRREYSLGGCVVAPDSPKTTQVYICPKCKEAFEWWSGTATAPYSVLPRDTRYDQNQHLRLVYLEAYGKGYVAAWAKKEALPVLSPTSEDDKARVFGYVEGAAAGRTARDAWSGENGQPYGPTNSASQKR